jgi:hypothetical protein
MSLGAAIFAIWIFIPLKVKCWSSYKGTQLIVTLRFGSVLQYGSGPSSDFLSKILGVDTTTFLWKTQFYFPLSSVLLHTLIKGSIFILSAIAQVVACLLMVWPPVFHSQAGFYFYFFFNYHVYHGYRGRQI